jgi:hypothetical protein
VSIYSSDVPSFTLMPSIRSAPFLNAYKRTHPTWIKTTHEGHVFEAVASVSQFST